MKSGLGSASARAKPKVLAGELALDQLLVEAPARRVAEHLREQRHRREVGAGPRRHVVADVDQRRAADPAQRHRALAVLRRVEGVVPAMTRVGRGIGPNDWATSSSTRAVSKRPETIRVALSGW